MSWKQFCRWIRMLLMSPTSSISNFQSLRTSKMKDEDRWQQLCDDCGAQCASTSKDNIPCQGGHEQQCCMVLLWPVPKGGTQMSKWISLPKNTPRFIGWDNERISTMKDVNDNFHHRCGSQKLWRKNPNWLYQNENKSEGNGLVTFLMASDSHRVINANQLLGEECEIITDVCQRHPTLVISQHFDSWDDIETLAMKDAHWYVFGNTEANEAFQSSVTN